MAVTAYLVRHGQTYLNLYNKVQGWIDSPLTSKGIADAQDAGDRLAKIEFDAAFTSDSGRAVATGREILKKNPRGMDIITYQYPELREQFHGYFEGENLEQMWQFVGEQVDITNEAGVLDHYGLERARDLIAKADLYNNAENNQQFWDRLNRGFDRIRENTEDGQNILIVSHGMTIRSIVDRYAPELDDGQAAKNGSITKLLIHPETIEVEYYNKLDQDV
ncbi:histidine phosphatase family protein [Fructilactobacillus carniphilus]|uniref:Histidine phosphatase family protein n=1 Tax=Fructilactobacillus carniphilus TaxID=2940297 RepID=A0ABY5BUZ2_9LACO|nr:histidine phosphatase family protein [Fructilactobacillus carniphilus]USS90321.1 histidine phosphatase family protein [Fructilactobacillus carniphilus]